MKAELIKICGIKLRDFYFAFPRKSGTYLSYAYIKSLNIPQINKLN